MATLQPRETTSAIIAHLLECFAIAGDPKVLKTDNAPAYTSNGFATFLTEFGIPHVTGIPYNPTGQAIVERAHQTLKNMLKKQKGGVAGWLTRAQLARAVYTLNFLQFRDDGLTPAMRFYGHCKSMSPQSPECNKAPPCPVGSKVWWKDDQGEWQGPNEVIVRGKGYLCVSTGNKEPGVWVPLRRTREAPPATEEQETAQRKEGEEEISESAKDADG